MEKGEGRHENTLFKRVKNKPKSSNTLNLYSSPTEKKRLTGKEPILKIKSNKLRHSNIKDFQGRRHDSRESNLASVWHETEKGGPTKSVPLFNEKPVIILTKSKLNPPKDLDSNAEKLLEKKKTLPPEDTSKNDTKQLMYSFDDHMAQWAENMHKPLIVPSTNVEFEIPYCYSEEFYSKLSANCYMMQPFSSIGEPVLTWNSYVDVWYEKAQLALQFYRQLCVQPSRTAIQVTSIKESAQLMAEHCTLFGTQLYFKAFNEDSSCMLDARVSVMGKKKNSAMYIVSEGRVQDKIELVNARVKNDNSIYSASWQT